MDIDFQAGDIVIDTITEEIGLLVERFDILEYASIELQNRVYGWEIIWTGKLARPDSRHMPYTENGLLKCVKDGMLIHIPVE